MTDPGRKHGLDERLSEAYNKMLSRVRATLQEVEKEARPTLHNAIENAKETATELGELTREEAERVGGYLRRDLRDAGEFLAHSGEDLAGWLRFDVELVEQSLAEMFWQVADQTKLELQQFKLQADAFGEWHTGEITGIGTLQCKSCGENLRFSKTGHIPPCPRCGGHTFRRLPRE